MIFTMKQIFWQYYSFYIDLSFNSSSPLPRLNKLVSRTKITKSITLQVFDRRYIQHCCLPQAYLTWRALKKMLYKYKLTYACDLTFLIGQTKYIPILQTHVYTRFIRVQMACLPVQILRHQSIISFRVRINPALLETSVADMKFDSITYSVLLPYRS